MRVYILEGNEVCDFTYDEEMELADSVMSVLHNRGAFETHTDIANDLYYAGTNGHVVRLSVLEEFLEATITLILRYEDADKPDLAPIMFEPEDNGRCHTAPGETRTGDEIVKSEWYTTEQVRAWREVWVNHRVDLARMDDCYRVFPGDEDGQSRENDRVLIKFFIEVMFAMDHYQMSYGQVVAEVKGRVPHANLNTIELNEVKSKYWDEAQKQHDALQRKNKKNRKMSPKMAQIKKRCAEHAKRHNPVNICDGGKATKAPPLKSRLSEVEAKKAYEKELADYQEYLNRGKK